MGTLGHKVFESLTQGKTNSSNFGIDATADVGLLHLKRKSRKSGLVIEAVCRQTNEGFVVLKGSRIETIDSGSIPPGILTSRKKAKIDENGFLLEDILFRSPSYAATFVIGGHTNGLTDWKTVDGKTLKEMEYERL